jgi:integrase
VAKYRHGSHTVYACQYHFVFIPKYRKPVLRGEIGTRLRDLVREIPSHVSREGAKGTKLYEFPDNTWKRIARLAGLTGGPHRARHTFASHFLQAKPDLFLLGPRSRSLTHPRDRAVRPFGSGAPGRRSERRLIRSPGALGSENPPWTHPSSRSEVS